MYGVSGIEIIIPMLEVSSFSWFPRKKKKKWKSGLVKKKEEKGVKISK